MTVTWVKVGPIILIARDYKAPVDVLIIADEDKDEPLSPAVLHRSSEPVATLTRKELAEAALEILYEDEVLDFYNSKRASHLPRLALLPVPPPKKPRAKRT